MDQTAETTTRRPAVLSLVRVLLLSGLAASTAVVVGLFFSSDPASAAPVTSPTDSSLLGGVTSTVGGVVQALDAPVASVGATAGGAVSSVTHVATDATAIATPVQHVVRAVAPAAAQVVQHVTATAPVSSVVAPVAQVVDQAVATTPVVPAVVGQAPVSTVTAPVAGVVDTTLGAVGAAAVAPAPDLPVPPVTVPSVTAPSVTAPSVTVPLPDVPGLPGTSTSSPVDEPSPAHTAAGVAAGDAETVLELAGEAPTLVVDDENADQAATLLAQIAGHAALSSYSALVVDQVGGHPRPLSPIPADHTPLDDGVPALPSSSTGTTGNSAAGAGAGSSGVLVGDTARPSSLPGLAVSAGSADGDDDLPSTPTFDTDSSPD